LKIPTKFEKLFITSPKKTPKFSIQFPNNQIDCSCFELREIKELIEKSGDLRREKRKESDVCMFEREYERK
jgi:hypothetical protein